MILYPVIQRYFLIPFFFLGCFVSAQVSGSIEVLAGQSLRFRNTSKAATEFRWDFGDGQTSLERHPVHQFETPGIYIVRLEASLDDCEEVTSQEVVVLPVTDESLEGISLFPVPAHENVTLAFPDSFSGEAEIRVVDQLGRILLEKTVIQEPGQVLQIPMDLTEWAAGNYWVEVKSGTDKQVLTLVRQ